MTPLSRAAQALHESLTTADISMNGDLATFAVIAVLKAIREPSDLMRSHGQWAISDNLTVSVCVENNITAAKVWTQMIDTLLNEGAAK